jgi:integrase
LVTWFDQHHRKHEEVAGKSLTQAKALYGKRKEDARLRKKLGPINQRKLTVGDILTKYEGELLNRGKRSAALYQRNLRIFESVFGSYELDELQPGDVEKWKAAEKKRGQAPATTNGRLAFLKRVFNLAIRDGLTERNPLAAGRVKMEKTDNEREEILSPEQEALLRPLVNHGFWLCIQFALHTGLRSAEMFQGVRRDLDLKTSNLTLPNTKSGKKQRVKLSPVAVDVIRQILALHHSDYLFPKSLMESTRVRGQDEPISGDLALDRFQKACKAIGLEGYVWHTLRHTFISRLAMLGIPILTVQKLARHKSIQMTLRYAHMQPDHQDEALAKLADSYRPKLDNCEQNCDHLFEPESGSGET